MTGKLFHGTADPPASSSREAVEAAIEGAKGARDSTWEAAMKRGPGRIPQWGIKPEADPKAVPASE